MKIYKKSADIYLHMPSLTLQFTGLAVVAAIVIAGCINPDDIAVPDGYEAAVKVLSGVAAIAGSLCLTAAIGRTFLRSVGIASFKAAYVAAMALSGPGLAEVLSAFRPVNVSNALLAYCMVVIISGVLWVRFYGHAA
ncbi:MAG: hypothetical protein WBZ29_00740 [Methanocella sp.]